MHPWLCVAFLFDCAEKLPWRHHLDPKLKVTSRLACAAIAASSTCGVIGVIGVPPPQVVDFVSPGFSEKQAEKRKRFPPRPTGFFSMAKQDLLVFKGERNGHVHLDLFQAHQVEDAPGGALSAAEGGHQDVCVENGLCVRDSDDS